MEDERDKMANGSNAGGLHRNSTKDASNPTTGLPANATRTNLDVWGGIPTTNNTANPATLMWCGEVHDDNANSHKFYEVTVNGTTVIRRWGRVPGYEMKSPPKSIIFEYDTDEAALTAASEIIQKKIRGGYTPLDVAE